MHPDKFSSMNWKQYRQEFAQNIKLSTPVFLGMLGHTLVGFVDNMMVGKISPTSLAAVSLGNSLIFIAMSFGIGFSTAITTLVAEAQGENSFRRSKSVLKHGLIINAILSVFLVILVHLSKPLMSLTGQDPEVIALASPYVDWVSVSLIPMMFFLSFDKFANGFSITKSPMFVTLIANAINIFLNYIFIYGNFGMPEMGVQGAAIGTLVSRFIMPFLMWYFLFINPLTRKYIIRFNWLTINSLPIKKIIHLGLPSSLQMVFESGIFIAATWISGALGKNFQASNQIAMTLASMTFMLPLAISTTATIRLGFLKGKKDFNSLKIVARSIFAMVFITQISTALGYVIFGDFIPHVFLDTNNLDTLNDVDFVIRNAVSLLIIAGIFQIPDGFQVVFLGALRGLQDVKIPMIINFIAYWLIAFPVSYYLAIRTNLKNQGIWLGLLIGLSCASVLLCFRFSLIMRRLKKENQ